MISGAASVSYRQPAANRMLHRCFQAHRPQEVTVIRRMAQVNLIVYYPKNEAGKEELARRVSDVHASAVSQRLRSLNCPAKQKLDLLDAVIDFYQRKSREQA